VAVLLKKKKKKIMKTACVSFAYNKMFAANIYIYIYIYVYIIYRRLRGL